MNNLNLPLVAPNQNQKEVTINDQALGLDAAFSEVLTVDLSEGDAVLTQPQYTRNFCFNCMGHTQPRTVTVWPSSRLFALRNGGPEAITVKTPQSGGAQVIVSSAQMAILYCDGTNVRTAVAGGQTTGVVEVPGDGYYVRTDGQWVRLLAGTNITLGETVAGELRISAPGGGEGGTAAYPDFTGNAGKVLTVNEYEDGVEWASDSVSAQNFLRVDASVSGNDTGAYATLANQFTLSEDQRCTGILAAFNPPAGSTYVGCIFAINSDTGAIVGSVASGMAFLPTRTGLQEHLFQLSPPVPLLKDQAYIMALVRTDGTDSAACRVGSMSGSRIYVSAKPTTFTSYLSDNDAVIRRWYRNNDPLATDVSQFSSSATGAYGIGLLFE
ncbi:hypothetical protein [Orrella sp. 11846]|uniref:hypothetical protein n=1 Tax=Orrella sp. 11846 TaxID=3409913 RepID=UPI003B5BA526